MRERQPIYKCNKPHCTFSRVWWGISWLVTVATGHLSAAEPLFLWEPHKVIQQTTNIKMIRKTSLWVAKPDLLWMGPYSARTEPFFNTIQDKCKIKVKATMINGKTTLCWLSHFSLWRGWQCLTRRLCCPWCCASLALLLKKFPLYCSNHWEVRSALAPTTQSPSCLSLIHLYTL